MDLTIETWGPPAIVLLVGAIGGLAYSLRRGLPWDHDPRMADLRARRELLMRRLRDLDADRGKLGDTDFEAQRAELVKETADVLRQLEEGLDAPKPPPATDPQGGSGWLTALGAVLFVVAAGIALQQGVSQRTDAPMTGGSSGGAPAVMPIVQAAQDALEADPNDAQALCTLRKYALYTRDLDGAMSLMERSQQAHPDDPCVVTHMAALKIMIGRFDEASAEIAALGSTAPNEAQIWRAIIVMQTSEDMDPAKDLLRSAVKNADDTLERDFASYLLSSLMMPPAQMPTQGGPQAGGPQGGAAPQVTGTIQGELEPGGVLYVYVRASQAERGPPLAALQIKDWSLPLEFDLSQATVIRAIPEEFYVSAKLSRSGDPMTTGPDDAVATPVGPVKAGDSIELRLE